MYSSFYGEECIYPEPLKLRGGCLHGVCTVFAVWSSHEVLDISTSCNLVEEIGGAVLYNFLAHC